ncbi:MAG: linear amide C-N hydrolase [Candidatus Eisenbacteria bacterium]
MRRSSRLAVAAAVTAALLCGAPICRACTSFAVYSETALYGMNFDYDPAVPVRLTIEESDGTRAFHLAFVRGPRRIPRTAGMNEHGLFVAQQELNPMVPDAPGRGPGEQCPWELYAQALADFAAVSDVEEHLLTHQMVDCPSVTLHLLFADPTGRAMIVEPGEDGTAVTPIERDRIVMTNFANCRFVNDDIDHVRGVGADRYKLAHDYIEEHFESFDVANGLELLERTSWELTRCSMVFDPELGEIYVALERDFDRIFRVSLEDGTIETYSGFEEHLSWRLNRWGVPTTALQEGRLGFFERIRGFFGR